MLQRLKKTSILFSLFTIYIICIGCNEKDKWKALPLKIKKQQSFNYSEVISGKLDSTQKKELEQVRKVISKDNNNLKKQLEKSRENKLEPITEKVNKFFNWLINIF